MSSSLSSHAPGPSDVAQDPNILPIPYNESDPLRNRTDDYFWNKDLPNDTIVCRTGRANVGGRETWACCPSGLGIYTTSTGCRMSNTTANTAFFANCTLQLELYRDPNATAAQVNATCVSFETYFNVTRQQRRDWLADKTPGELGLDRSVDSVPVCASVGNPQRLNYTGQCCARLGGHKTTVEGGVSDTDRSASAAIDCYPRTNDPEFTTRFSECIEDFGTWPVCAQSRDRKENPGTPAQSGAPAASCLGASLLVAGAALALLV